jgi:hypothetical protein
MIATYALPSVIMFLLSFLTTFHSLNRNPHSTGMIEHGSTYLDLSVSRRQSVDSMSEISRHDDVSPLRKNSTFSIPGTPGLSRESVASSMASDMHAP